MLHFLSALFKPTGGETGAPDKALIEAATERAIDGTDPRLRAFFVSASTCRKSWAAARPCGISCRASLRPLPRRGLGLLTLTWKEGTVLGTEQRGEISRRAVKQQSVTFTQAQRYPA